MLEKRGERKFGRTAGRNRIIQGQSYTLDRDKNGLPSGLKNGGTRSMHTGDVFSNDEIRRMRFIRHQKKHGRS